MLLPGKRGRNMKLDNMKLKKFFTGSAVPLLFLVIIIVAIPLSGYTGTFLAREDCNSLW